MRCDEMWCDVMWCDVMRCDEMWCGDWRWHGLDSMADTLDSLGSAEEPTSLDLNCLLRLKIQKFNTCVLVNVWIIFVLCCVVLCCALNLDFGRKQRGVGSGWRSEQWIHFGSFRVKNINKKKKQKQKQKQTKSGANASTNQQLQLQAQVHRIFVMVHFLCLYFCLFLYVFVSVFLFVCLFVVVVVFSLPFCLHFLSVIPFSIFHFFLHSFLFISALSKQLTFHSAHSSLPHFQFPLTCYSHPIHSFFISSVFRLFQSFTSHKPKFTIHSPFSILHSTFNIHPNHPIRFHSNWFIPMILLLTFHSTLPRETCQNLTPSRVASSSSTKFSNQFFCSLLIWVF